MFKRIILDTTLLKSNASSTTTAFTWNDVSDVVPPSEETSFDTAENHRFVINGVEYVPNYALDGDTKFKIAYKVDNVDTIMLELIKSTGLANIKIRKDKDINIGESDEISFEFYELMNGKEFGTSIVKFGENLIARVTYENDEWKVEGI